MKGANHFDGRSRSRHNQSFCIEGIALLIHRYMSLNTNLLFYKVNLPNKALMEHLL